METQRINCLKCKFYYVTWDSRMPYGCKAFGFKSRQMPSIVVYKSSGKSCQGFEEKTRASNR